MTLHTRCKFYNDQGDLLDKYHKGYCRFAHPDMPAWNTATRPRMHSDSMSQGRRQSKSDFATSSWGADGPATSTNAIDTPHGRKSWGHASNKQNENKEAKQPESATASGSSWQDIVGNHGYNGSWDSSHNNGWASEGRGWGSGDVEMGEINDTGPTRNSGALRKESGSWGSGGAGREGSTWTSGGGGKEASSQGSGGTGKEAKSWGSGGTEKETSAWGSGGSRKETNSWASGGTGWGNVEVSAGGDLSTPGSSKEVQSSKRNEPDTTSYTTSARAHSASTSAAAPSHTVSEAKKPGLARLDTNLQAHSTIASSQPTKTQNATPNTGGALGARFSAIEDDPLSSLSPVSASFYQNYKGYKGRLRLFKEIILHMQEAIMYHMIHAQAQSEATRWKKAQTSEIYAHPTKKARSILETRMAEFGDKVTQAKRSRDRALQHLARLPDMGSSTHKLSDPIRTSETIIRYTTELKEWFEDLEIQRRITRDTTKDAAEPPKPDQSSADDLSALLSSDSWSWQDLKKALTLLEGSINDSFELVYSEKFTNQDFLADPLARLAERLNPAEILHVPNALEGDAKNLHSNSDSVDDKITSVVPRAAELVTKLDNLEREYMELEAERAKIDAFCDETEKILSQLEERNQVHDENLAVLTNQVQQLFLHKPPVQPTQHTTPKPIPIEGYLDCLRPMIMEYMKREMERISDNLLARCHENQEQTSKAVDQMIQPLIFLTEQVRRTPQPQEVDNAQIVQ